MNCRGLLSEILRRELPSINGEELLRDVEGWDSLKGVRLVIRLEEIVGRELSEDELEKLQSVGDVERLLNGGK